MIACYDCKDRYPACQSKCEIGIALAETRRRKNEVIKTERMKEYMVDEVNINATMRLKRRIRSV